MKTAETARTRVETHGQVPPWAVGLALAKVDSVLRVAAEPVLSARVMLAVAADPSVARPAVAQVTVDMNGHVIRAQAAGEDVRVAVGQMAARLRVRLGRAARNWAALRGTAATEEQGEWRHQSIPANRPRYFARPADQRLVFRRFSYAADRETAEQAVAELDLLDYDFHLFTEAASGEDCVLYRAGDGFRLLMAHPERAVDTLPLPGVVTVGALPPPTLTVTAATQRLDATGELFLFFTDAATGRGSVAYRRYDGHYGLLEPAGAERRGRR